jgi:SAM-dependent methyltransferase
LIEGVPVLTVDVAPRVIPPEHQSFQLPSELVAELACLDGWWLHIGAGATGNRVENCVELEMNIFRNTDLVGDIARLPLRSRTFEAVVAFNVFEHLPDPWGSAAEILRVLAPGGRVIIQTAFLQPLHADPDHYFGATEAGVREWFKEFEIESVSVSGNFSPAFTISWIASELLYGAPDDDTREALAAARLGDLGRYWADPSSRAGSLWESLTHLPPLTERRLAAGFELRGRRRL